MYAVDRNYTSEIKQYPTLKKLYDAYVNTLNSYQKITDDCKTKIGWINQNDETEEDMSVMKTQMDNIQNNNTKIVEKFDGVLILNDNIIITINKLTETIKQFKIVDNENEIITNINGDVTKLTTTLYDYILQLNSVFKPYNLTINTTEDIVNIMKTQLKQIKFIEDIKQFIMTFQKSVNKLIYQDDGTINETQKIDLNLNLMKLKSNVDTFFNLIRDSKTLSEKQRESLFDFIAAVAFFR